jgi:hypothetical protein
MGVSHDAQGSDRCGLGGGWLWANRESNATQLDNTTSADYNDVLGTCHDGLHERTAKTDSRTACSPHARHAQVRPQCLRFAHQAAD